MLALRRLRGHTTKAALDPAGGLRVPGAPMRGPPLERYHARVAAGEMEGDAAQTAVVERLDVLAAILKTWRPKRSGFIAHMFSSRAEVPRGLYIHGAVGRGKTVLMDLFFRAVEFEPKRRLHFHEFMAEVHDLLAEARHTVEGDPIPHVAASIARRAQLLCFDELHITDVADAMILARLFKKLFDAQVVLVATSNVAPRELYKNGLQRENFLPFVDLIEERLDVVELSAAKDYRLDRLSGQQLYFTPLDELARRALSAAFTRMTGVWNGAPVTLDNKGRSLRVPQAARGVARFTFADLCEQPLGAQDYLAFARAFHTIIIEAIPVMGPEKRNEARRFINLIDTLYDNHIGLIASAEAEPDKLYVAGDGVPLFQRTVSRLMEMRTEAYLASRAARND
jgi:cell division protein ZapE